MNEWIECNLAWQVRLSNPETEPYPNMDAKVKVHFGATKDELEERFYPGLHSNGLEYLSDHPTFKEYSRIRDELEENYYDEELKQKLQLHPSDAVQTVLACRGICREIEDWIEVQPEWIAACDAADQAWKVHKEAEAKLSFCGQNLNQAGTVIEFEEEGKLRQMMIGTINELGGSCDDCRGISDDTVILRYKTLWHGSINQSNT
jgi:hypothetical protein